MQKLWRKSHSCVRYKPTSVISPPHWIQIEQKEGTEIRQENFYVLFLDAMEENW
jgi:hypothetical protein